MSVGISDFQRVRIEHQIYVGGYDSWVTFAHEEKTISMTPFVGHLDITLTSSEFDPTQQNRVIVTLYPEYKGEK